MSKHILEVIDPSYDWIVFGKGPSFNINAASLVANPKTICINQTSNFVAADIAIMNDLPVISYLDEFSIINTKYFALPSCVGRFIRQESDGTSFWVDNAKKLFCMAERVRYFDSNLSPYRFLEDKPLLHAHVSTFETCVWLLAYAGVKKIYTSGIDHTTNYHKTFGERVGDCPYNAVPYYIKVATDHFGIEVIAL